MNILGINGWMERGHDAAACLIMNGKIVAMAEEERFIRKKYSFDVLPINAVAYCLQRAGITSDEINVISWGWNLPLLYSSHGRKFEYSTSELNEFIFPRKYYPRKNRVIPVEFVNHHEAHAASSYCMRDTDEDVAIIVIDGGGENTSASIFIGSNGKIKKIKSFPMIDSLGYFYEAACQYIGFSRTQAGKLMGLASHGNPISGKDFFYLSDEAISVPFQRISLPIKGALDWEDEVVREWLKIFESRWGKKNLARKEKNQFRFTPTKIEKNIAATIQKEFERIYTWLICEAINFTGAKNIAMAGGSTLNCSANGCAINVFRGNKFYFQPMANDAGTALGAAAMMLPEIPSGLFCSPYLGPSFSREDLKQVLIQSEVNFTEPIDIYQDAAEAIAGGKVIGWFDGGMEVGPRALGARSILANPHDKRMHEVVNNVKSREQWRPLAPSVMSDYVGRYFLGGAFSPYMLIRSYVRSERREDIAAVVHVDDSVRPQVVNKSTSPSYYRLIDRFYRLTGIPMLLNTSFNNEREPIVCTPIDAIRTFFETEIDLLIMGPYMIRK